MDESVFCLDPKKSNNCKAYNITQCGGRENTTIVGVVNASGRVLDPASDYKSSAKFPAVMARR